jgi:signal transduction histidine kinase
VKNGVAVEVDSHLLASAVSNLLQNAFKFTHARGHVSLRARKKGDRVLIEVEDECGGLPPGKAEELFRPFERRGTDKSGLGLGLATIRRSVPPSRITATCESSRSAYAGAQPPWPGSAPCTC